MKTSHPTGQSGQTPQLDAQVFHFEDITGLHSLFDFIGCYDNGQYFEPPVSLLNIIKLLSSGVHHASAVQAKLNILKGTFKPTPLLSRAEFEKLAFNFIVLGNGYLEMPRNRFGGLLPFKNRLALYMRRSSNLRDFVYLRDDLQQIKYEKIQGENIIHIMQPNLQQEIYGLPSYLAAMDSVDLNAAATRFRVRYYKNGSHAGFILYCNSDQVNEDDWESLKSQLKQSKGMGNFKNVMLRIPNGHPDGLKLIPIAEVAAKDEFLNIKHIFRAHLLNI